MKKKNLRLLVWVVYLLIVLLPLIVMMVFPMPKGRDFWRDFSVGLGFVGLAMAGMQFIPTARLRFLSDIFDMDHVYKVHHYLSIVSVLLVAVHPIILLVNNPYVINFFNPFTAPWRAQAGWIGLGSLLLIAITSVLRTDLKLDYNAWHGIHDLLAAAIAVFALIHISKVNYYASTAAVKWVWAFEVLIWVGMTVYVRIIKPIYLLKYPYTIKEVIEETWDTWTIVLEPKGHAGFDFNASQVAWININSSPFTLHKNPFSISGSAHRREELRFSIKNLGDFTSTIGNLKGGETVYVDGPYGSFSLNEPNMQNGLVFLAGGIGSAPIMSMLHTLADANDQRPVYFFYGCYDEENIVFKEDLNTLVKKLDLKIFYVLEKPKSTEKYLQGYITLDLLDKELPANRKELFYYICGPLPMIDAMESHLNQLGIPDYKVNKEKYEMA
jgi:predicted ferric reductase